jgi:Glu-tRNA(Gln) amidotransferase subunit E-like FAD-binding protein
MDYEKLGFKAGLEIHQQLDAGKLFCRCPSYLRKEEPHFTVKRKLHKVAGETGEIDTAVLYEASLNKIFEYQGYNDTTCLVELDEEPPKEINEAALDEAIKISLLLNCEIVPVTQVMRKTVLDGSNTSGFQRTLLIAQDGWVETSFGKIGIDYVYLEEDACRAISREKDKDVYRLDRLGIPLMEIVTAPDAKNAEQVKELALKIGEVLRACNVKRGIGTIRQDINISIKGHPRSEIKGFQEPRFFVTVVDKEIERQQENLKEKKELKNEVRGALEDGTTKFLRPLPGGARMYPETDLPLLKISRERINKIKKELPKLKNEIRDELKKKGLSDELIDLVLDGNLDEFEILMKVYSKDANLVGKMVTLWRKEFASKEKKSFEEIKDILTENVLEKILEAVKSGKIEKDDAKKVMSEVVAGKKVEDALKVEKVSHDTLEEEIAKIVKEKPGLRPNAYMGLVMAKFKGKIDAKKAMEILNKLVGKNDTNH